MSAISMAASVDELLGSASRFCGTGLIWQITTFRRTQPASCGLFCGRKMSIETTEETADRLKKGDERMDDLQEQIDSSARSDQFENTRN